LFNERERAAKSIGQMCRRIIYIEFIIRETLFQWSKKTNCALDNAKKLRANKLRHSSEQHKYALLFAIVAMPDKSRSCRHADQGFRTLIISAAANICISHCARR
jgi:hypothetical protein